MEGMCGNKFPLHDGSEILLLLPFQKGDSAVFKIPGETQVWYAKAPKNCF